MPPLEFEVYREQSKSWIKAGKLKPGDGLGSISDNKPDGKRDIYLFECARNGSKSIIYRSVLGLDLESAEGRANYIFRPLKT